MPKPQASWTAMDDQIEATAEATALDGDGREVAVSQRALKQSKKRHRLNPRGNRQLNHALHVIAMAQISHNSLGRVYYDRKITAGRRRPQRRAQRPASIGPSAPRCLRLDDVVDWDDLGRAGELDARLLKDPHQPLAEPFRLPPRLP